ncbi:LINE-1 reverse transcriptase like [Trifolium medium]|uniref:LINE-1 reverse transcriptase like n=1 Tax=Trifolium medium TaxID=97028 RepID=A0A392QKU9_9FABA|nr:LINE-1 reverse transcriptase like [Trifolium medium]
MKFPEKWLEWMRACIFTSSMSILVNGSPTEEFTIGKGLREGDPLSPFLFIIAAEGLTRLTQKVVEIGSFRAFRVNGELNFDIMQFAEDNILIGEGSWDNLWSIKTILRSFEMVSGLKVIFFQKQAIWCEFGRVIFGRGGKLPLL